MSRHAVRAEPYFSRGDYRVLSVSRAHRQSVGAVWVSARPDEVQRCTRPRPRGRGRTYSMRPQILNALYAGIVCDAVTVLVVAAIVKFA